MQDGAVRSDDINALGMRSPNTVKGDLFRGQLFLALEGFAVVKAINPFAAYGMDLVDIFSPETKQIVDGVGFPVLPLLAIPKQDSPPPTPNTNRLSES